MAFNWLIFVIIVIAQYVIGALWYSLIFGKQWLQINHPEGAPSKAEMEKIGKEAGPLYGIQLVITIITLWVQWKFIAIDPKSWLETSFLIWLGFLVPTLIQSVIWSDPKNKKKLLQIAIVALNLIVTSILAGWVFATFR